ncbi:MAG: hypothetical protein K2K91_12010 [Ruminococcus sp.]|nr:hypothetical protein [Ruminococcus sp.]
MTIFESITLSIFAVMVILCIAQIITIIMWHSKIKKYDSKIAISRKKTDSYIWILLALANIAVESRMLINSIHDFNYNTNTKGYLFIVLMWTAFMVYVFLPTLFVSKHYITPDFVLMQGAKNDMFSKEDVQYSIDGDVLKIYHKKNSTVYKITDKKDELLKMLSENYKQYEKKEKKS